MGFGEILIIILILLLLFGGGALIKVFRSAGKSVKSFKEGLTEDEDED